MKNSKGAVTVIVTLLLIPSILVSGTAVDVARIYSAKSIVQDANSLGANAAMAQYNALLKDLYGLYGIEDTKLQSMVNDYIKIALFGDSNTNKGTSMFSNYATNKPNAAEKKEVSLAEIPFGKEVNYFYQSEQEFLYGGSSLASDNLKAVSGMIFLVRFIMNYVEVSS